MTTTTDPDDILSLDLSDAIASVRAASSRFFANDKWLTANLNDATAEATKLLCRITELKSTFACKYANNHYRELVESFLSVPREFSGIVSDEEAACVAAFAKKVLIVHSSMERIEVKHGCTDMFSTVVARIGDALLRYCRHENESIGEIRSERVLVKKADDTAIALNETLIVDTYNCRDALDQWTDATDDALVRDTIGASHCEGLSDDTLIQLVFGSLGDQIDDSDHLSDDSCPLRDASEFLLSEFTAPELSDDAERDEQSQKRKQQDSDDNDNDEPSASCDAPKKLRRVDLEEI